MISCISRILEGHDNLGIILKSLFCKDIETTVGKCLYREHTDFLTVSSNSNAIVRVNQTRSATLLHQLRQVRVKTKVYLDGLVRVFNHRTELEYLEDNVIEIIIVGISQLIQVKSDRSKHATTAVRTCLLSGHLTLSGKGLPVFSEVYITQHLIVDIITGFSVCLCAGLSSSISTIVE